MISSQAAERQGTMISFKGVLKTGILLLCAATAVGETSVINETDSFHEISNNVAMLSELYGPEGVLLVFDIDNTLLASDQPLGSAQWYSWQDSLLEVDSDSPLRAAEDIQELLRIQGVIFTLSGMHLTEDTIPELIQSWQNQGHRCVVLTARGQDFNDATQRELNQAGLNFSILPPDVFPEFNGVSIPYSVNDPGAAGLTIWEAVDWELEPPREVRYEKGVFMVAGQNKGAMLLILLANCPRSFPAVVFVDDNSENVEEVYTMLNDRGIDITAFRYGEEDDTVEAFTEEQRERTAVELAELFERIDGIFP